MVKLLHLTSRLDDVLAAGEINGHPNHYDIERGVSKELMVIFGQVVSDEACCSHLGDALVISSHQLECVSERWHLAFPEACRFRLGGDHKFFQLYLMPHNNPLFAQGLEKFGGDEVDALGNLGLEYICSVTADALPQALEAQLLPLDPVAQHLHAIICLDTLPLLDKTTKPEAPARADVTAAPKDATIAAAGINEATTAGGGGGASNGSRGASGGVKSCGEVAAGPEGTLQKVMENAAMHQVV